MTCRPFPHERVSGSLSLYLAILSNRYARICRVLSLDHPNITVQKMSSSSRTTLGFFCRVFVGLAVGLTYYWSDSPLPASLVYAPVASMVISLQSISFVFVMISWSPVCWMYRLQSYIILSYSSRSAASAATCSSII